VIPLEIPGDPLRPEMILTAEVKDLLDDL